MTPPWLIRLAERTLPAAGVRLARGAVRRLAARRLGRAVRRLEGPHRGRNAGLPPDRLRLPDGTVVAVSPQARGTYEQFCYTEPDMAAEFGAFVRAAAGRSRLLDVGAEHGFFPLAFTLGGPGREAVAVEPSPAAYPVLVDQLGRNPGAAVRPVHVALGAAAGELEVAVRAGQAVAAVGYYAELDPGNRLRVPVRTADDLCRDLAFAPDLMKVDVEGYELFVLRGAEGVLARHAPVLLLEVHPGLIEAMGYAVADLLDALAGWGYAHVDDQTGRPCPFPAYNPKAGSVRTVFRKGPA